MLFCLFCLLLLCAFILKNNYSNHFLCLGENEIFQSFYARFLVTLNPDDITPELYSAKMITRSERDEANNEIAINRQRMIKLLAAVERAISADCVNFSKFLDILNKFPIYERLVMDIRKC